MREEPLELFHDGRGWRVGVWNNVILTAIAEPPDAAALAGIRRARERARARGELGGLTVIVGVRLANLDFGEAMRAEVAGLLQGANLRGYAAVAVESPGIVGATVRTILSGLFLLTRPDMPHRVFDTRVLAAEHLMHKVTTGWAAEELVGVTNRLTAGI